MIVFLDNLTGKIDDPTEAQARRYGEEVLCAEWNPAVNELQTCLLTVAEAEEREGRRG